METAYNFLNPEKFNIASDASYILNKRKANNKIIVVGIFCLIVGGTIGYCICNELKREKQYS
jgi:hypothetical protein